MKVRYGDGLELELRTGGLTDSTDPHFDEQRARRRDPRERARAWKRLACQMKMPINTGFSDGQLGPPNAGCYAIKAAQLQGPVQGEAMARKLREAVFIWNTNIADMANLLAAATETEGLDPRRFERDLTSERAQQAFIADWEAARNPAPGASGTKASGSRRRYGFPTLEFYAPESDVPGVVLGYQPPASYEVYDRAVLGVDPSATRQRAPAPADLVKLFPTLTTLEVAACCDLSIERACAEMLRLEERGQLERSTYGWGQWAILWTRL